MADLLSRQKHAPDHCVDVESHLINEVSVEEDLIGDPTVLKMAELAATDLEYCEILDILRENKLLSEIPHNNLATNMKQMWPHMSFLETEKGGLLVINSDKIVIPIGERKHILETLHASHAAGSTMYHSAREHVFWPGMKAQCLDHANACTTCAHDAPKMTRGASINEVPSLATMEPMEAIGADLFHINGKTMLAIVDRASSFISCKYVKNEGTNSVTEALEEFFCRYGTPSRLRTDGGPAFKSSSFEQWVQDLGIIHELSSP